MTFSKEMLDDILKDYRGPEDMMGQEGIIKQLSKALIERAMETELTEQLGYEKSDQAEKPTANRRNGKSARQLRTDEGPMEIEIRRDREGKLEPAIVPSET
jgi:transposase-like protein